MSADHGDAVALRPPSSGTRIAATGESLMAVFAATIFLSACLLFVVQPLVGKVLLPWFGGAPAVWTTCMLFFQVLLLMGYGWAHLLARQAPRRQALAQLGLLALAVGAMAIGTIAWGRPLIPDESLKPPDSLYPAARLILLLALAVGLPYLALSTTGPLLQAWFARVHPGRSAYRLYALSNAGSLLALVSYPFLVEPALSLKTQGWVFAIGFALFAAGSALIALRTQAV
ncbi:MAG: hypothetical protein HY901_27415, partial [Deltaproteobacteria bacterium]|nr:hypothetical protein [Deltaproteobacteria bacterium]